MSWRAVDSRRKILGIDHFETVDSIVFLAHVLSFRGKYCRATQLDQEASGHQAESTGRGASSDAIEYGQLSIHV